MNREDYELMGPMVLMKHCEGLERDAARMRLLMSLDVRWSGASPIGDPKRPYYAKLSKGDRSSTATGATLAELADTASVWLESVSGVGDPK